MTKPLKLLVVEDGQENLNHARSAYEPFEKEGLIKVSYRTKYQEALPLIDVVDAGILDLYFPGDNSEEIIKNLLNEYKVGSFSVEDLRLQSGLLPLGFSLARKLKDGGKPSILASTASTGHGGKGIHNPFYKLRRLSEYTSLGESWNPSEAAGMKYSFVTNSFEFKDKGDYDELLVKGEKGWLAALKGITMVTKNDEIVKIIKLEEIDENRPSWESIEGKLMNWFTEYHSKS